MSFENWLDLQIEKELSNNPELRKVFAANPERHEMYKQKLIDSESSIDGGLRQRYREEMKNK